VGPVSARLAVLPEEDVSVSAVPPPGDPPRARVQHEAGGHGADLKGVDRRRRQVQELQVGPMIAPAPRRGGFSVGIHADGREADGAVLVGVHPSGDRLELVDVPVGPLEPHVPAALERGSGVHAHRGPRDPRAGEGEEEVEDEQGPAGAPEQVAQLERGAVQKAEERQVHRDARLARLESLA